MEQTTEKPDHQVAREECAALLERLGVTMKLSNPIACEFYGTREERQKAEKESGEKAWQHVRWTCTIRHDRGFVAEIETVYKMGIGNYLPPNQIDKLDTLKLLTERIGSIQRHLKNPEHWPMSDKKGIPTAPDVVGCLCRDALMGIENTWENFAAELGYDTDSRKAYKIWEACKDTFSDLVRLGLSMEDVRAVAELANRF